MRPTTATQLHQQVPVLHSREESFEYGRGYIRRLSANPNPIDSVSPIESNNRLLRHTEASIARKDFVDNKSNDPSNNSAQRRPSFQATTIIGRRPSVLENQAPSRRTSVSLSPPTSPRRPSVKSNSQSPPISRLSMRQTDEESVFVAFAKMSSRAIYTEDLSPLGSSLAPSPNVTPRSNSPSGHLHKEPPSTEKLESPHGETVADAAEESVFSVFSKRASISANIATDVDSFYGRKT